MPNSRIYYSCVVDASPQFVFQGWGLVNALLKLADVHASQIVVHHTPEVDSAFVAEFANLGVAVRPLARFGDGAYCNKIAQLSNPAFQDADCVFLLDADMVVLESIESLFDPSAIKGKVVDLPNPEIAILRQIFDLAGFNQHPAICKAGSSNDETFHANLNGGLYVIPGSFVSNLGKRWRHWALWLLDNSELLVAAGKQQHVDQIAFALAVHERSIPVKHVERRYNNPLHHDADRSGYPAVIHYHGNVSKTGLLEPPGHCDREFTRAVEDANRLLGGCFNNRVFWSFRYQMFPELGSGIGSRGENLTYKRRMLQSLGVEKSESILDVGCGDLEVVRSLRLRGYTGVDVSPEAIRIARSKRPDLSFMLIGDDDEARIPSADTVLCLEVLIHQQSARAYERLIALLATKTKRRLIVSGYNTKQAHHDSNHMIHFNDSLSESLKRTKVFSTVEVVGHHTDVDIVLARTARCR